MLITGRRQHDHGDRELISHFPLLWRTVLVSDVLGNHICFSGSVVRMALRRPMPSQSQESCFSSRVRLSSLFQRLQRLLHCCVHGNAGVPFPFPLTCVRVCSGEILV